MRKRKKQDKDGDGPKIVDVVDAKQKEKMKIKKFQEVSHEWGELNQNKPLWMRKSEDVINEA